MRRTSLEDARCPIARSLEQIGDWWTLLIIRDALQGKRRFTEFQQSLGLAKNILSTRLSKLVTHGILERRAAEEGAREEYHLTDKGRQLRLILTALRQWGEDYLFEDGEPMMVAYAPNKRPVARLQLMDQDGRALKPEEITVVQGLKRGHGGNATQSRSTARR